MRGISGVGAVKLERFGPDFLKVVAGANADIPHPARRRLAGGAGAPLYDRLEAAQRALAKGPDGHDKPLSCTASTLARIAEIRPRDLEALARILGPAKAERFGPAFLEALSDSD
jgi:ATP-dependent DNA helicase RecQ